MLQSKVVSSRRISRVALLISAAVAAIPAVAGAQSWTAATGTWNTASNWGGNAVPTSAATTALTFGGAGGYTSTNDVATQPFVLNSLTFDALSPVTVAGGTLSFSGTTPTIVNNNTGAVTVSSAVSVISNVTVTGTGSSTLTLAGRVTGVATVGLSTQSQNVALSGGAAVGYLGVGSGTTTLSGAGTFNFNSGSNPDVGTPVGNAEGNPTGGAFANPTVALSAGTIAGQTGTLIIDNTSVVMTGGTNNVYAGNGGDGVIILRNGALLRNVTATGGARFGTFLGNGQISVESGSVVDTRLIELGRGASVSSTTVTGTGSRIVGTQLAIGRAISNEFVTASSVTTLTIANGGTVRVENRNPTNTFGGVVFLGAANTNSTINVLAGGTASFQGQLQLALSGAVLGQGSATINVDGAGANLSVVRQLVGTNVFGGANGVVFLSDTPDGTASVNIRNGGRFTAFTFQHGFTASSAGPVNVNVESGGALNLQSGALFGRGADGTTNLVVDGGAINVNTAAANAGFLDFGSGTGTTSNITLRNGGTVSVVSGTAAGAGQVIFSNASGATSTVNIESGSTFATQGSMFVSSELGASATINLSGASTLTTRNDFIVASDGADVTGSASVNLSGGSTLNTRFLVVSNAGSLTATNSTINAAVVDDLGAVAGNTGDIAINGTSALNLVGSATSTNTFFGDYSGVLSGSGSVAVNGPNVFQTLRGLNSYSGLTSVNRGTLFVPSSVPASGSGPLGSATSAVVIGAGPGATGGFAQLAIGAGALFARQITVSGDNDNTAVIRGEGDSSEPTTTVSGLVTINGTKVLTTTTFGGTISFTGNIAGTGSLIADGFGSDTLAFTGTTVLVGAKTFSGELGVATGARMVLTGPASNTSSTKLLDVDGITVFGQAAAAGTNANTGVLAVNPLGVNGGRTSRPNVIVTDFLDIAGNAAPLGSRQYFGFFDLGDSDLVIRNVDAAAAATTLAEVRDYVRAWSVANGGLPGAVGLGSSQSFYTTDGDFTTLAVYDNSGVGGSTVFTTFDGVPVGATDVLVKYTYLGDTNLDGVVNATDLARILQGLNGAGTGWNFGDVNYDGVVNTLDLGRALAALRGQGAPLGDEGSLTGGGVIPEPSSLGLLIAAVPLMSRRRRA